MTKKQSVNVPDKAYKHKPKFSVSIIKEFSELFKWLKQISRFSRVEDFIYIANYKPKESMTIKIFTKDHQYRIYAYLPKKDKNGADNGCLGCIAETRKPRAGEDWNRGNDLVDGGYSEKTWQEIKSDILAYELVKVVRNSPDKENGKAIEAVVDDNKKFLTEALEHNLSKLKSQDEIGFTWNKQHYVVRKGEFSS